MLKSKNVPDGTEVIATKLNIPWSIEFSPSGVLYFTERSGTLSKIDNGVKTSLLELNVKAKKNDESGLLGLAFSPNYINNHFIYLYYTYPTGATTWNRVSRFKETENRIKDETIIIDKIPGARARAETETPKV